MSKKKIKNKFKIANCNSINIFFIIIFHFGNFTYISLLQDSWDDAIIQLNLFR